jgi:hypothetical protein
LPGFIYLAAVSSVACLFISVYPSLAFIGGTAWGVSLVLGGYLLTRNKLSMLFGFNILLLYWLAGSSSLFLLLVFGIPSYIIGLLLNRQKGYYELQKWGIVSAVTLVSLFMLLAYNTNTDIQLEINQYVQESINVSEESGFLKYYEQQGISQEEMKENLAIVTHWMTMHLPAFYYIQAIFAVYIILILSSYISRRKNLPILAKRPFSDEVMPWQITWAIIIALSLWIWGRDDMANIYYVGSNMLVTALPVTLYYGLSCLTFRWKRAGSGSKKWMLAIFVITTLIMTIPIVMFVSLLGLFDSLMDYRKLNIKKEEVI